MGLKPVRAAIRFLVALATVSALGALNAPVRAQETGTVTGTVTDAASGSPIVGARILLQGTNIWVPTDRDGQFTLRNVPVGAQVVRAVMIGYDLGRGEVNVTSGTVPLSFELTRAIVNLDEIVVTATGEQRRREVANAITSIETSEVAAEFAPTNVGSLIQGRASGVQILNASGTAGTSQQIRIRGASSISLTNEPLLVVDGIRVENGIGVGFGTGGQSISRMNDFNPDEIESIEIVKGPSAAALFGTAAANGVIVIRTKRGRVGRPVWTAYVEQGVTQEVTEWPDNYRGLDASGSSCRLINVAAGSCTQAEVRTANPLASERTGPFKDGYRQQYGVTVNGGSEGVQYFVAGEWEAEDGIFGLPSATTDSILAAGGVIPDYAANPNRLERAHFRANVSAQLGTKADVRVSTGFVSSDTWLPQNDNNVTGMLPSGLLGGTDSTASRGGWGFYTPEEIFYIEGKQGVERFTGSTNLSWRPTTWLEGYATAGLDWTGRRDIRFQATGTGVNFSTRRQGDRTSDRTLILNYTLDAGATAQFALSESISSKTTAGWQYNRRNLEQTETTGQILAPGSGSNKSASTQFIDEDFVESRTLGVYVEQQLGFNDRLYINGALRADDNNAFGKDFDLTVYPKAGASYVVIDQGAGLVDNFRVRAAYGASGVQPGSNDAILFFTGTAIVDDSGEQVGVSIAGAGNTNLKPERSEEFEAGFDLGFLGGRASLEGTYYQRNTSDALISRRLAPSIGLTTSRFENIGKTKNSGLEGLLNISLIESDALQWETTLSASTNDNEIVELGEGVEPITFGSQKHAEGYPLGAWFDEDFEYNDANNDGIIDQSELSFDLDGDGSRDTTVFLGYPTPRYEASWYNAFTLFNGRIRVSGLFDYRGGHKKYNLTEAFRCGFNICAGLNDPNTSLEDQAQAQTRRSGVGTAAGFLEPGWFIKMRELALTINFPQAWAQAVRTDRLSLTFTGRNLFTITDYEGSDPEVEQFVGSFGSRDFLTQPQVRMFFARLNVSF